MYNFSLLFLSSVNSLCEGQPTEFAIYLNYTRSLMFEEEPDYTYLKQILRLLFRSMSYQYDYRFDWSDSTDPLVKEMIQYKNNKRSQKGKQRLSGTPAGLTQSTMVNRPGPEIGVDEEEQN